MQNGAVHGERVLIIGPYAPSVLSFRGDLLRDLRQNGHEVHAAAPDMTEALRKAFVEMGVVAHDLPLERAGTNPLKELGTIWQLFRLMRRVRPTTVLCYSPKPVMYGLLAARVARVGKRYGMITGLGYAFTAGSGIRRTLIRSVSKLLYKLAFASARRVIFQNPDDQAEMAAAGILSAHALSASVVVNGSGVDLSRYPQTPMPPLPLRFFMACRLLGDKGVREYAAASSAIRKAFPNVECVLAGPFDSNLSSVSREELDNWVKGGALEYVGSLPGISQELARCHVFVLPSYREGTPRTVLEAMSTGRPVITTDAPGCRETVANGKSGFLIEVASSSALEEAMRRFVLEPGLTVEMGKAARAMAVEKYDVRKVNATMMAAMDL
jgi:glycosyltransferase involved in cell wall biosynthesis